MRIGTYQIANKAPGIYYRESISLIELLQRFPNDELTEQWFNESRWNDSDGKFSGTVEVDETYMSRTENNKHWDKKLNAGRGGVGKTTAIGAKERETKRNPLHSFIQDYVAECSVANSDEFKSYEKLSGYDHQLGQTLRW